MVVAEDRNVTGMLRNRRLAQSRSDQSLGRVRQPLGSKTCSAGGTVKAKRSLAECVSRCEGCGLVIDREVGATRSLLQPAVRGRGAGGAREGQRCWAWWGWEQEAGAARVPRGLILWGSPPPGTWWRWVVSFLMLTDSQRNSATPAGLILIDTVSSFHLLWKGLRPPHVPTLVERHGYP
jgi:hypothetical protein